MTNPGGYRTIVMLAAIAVAAGACSGQPAARTAAAGAVPSPVPSPVRLPPSPAQPVLTVTGRITNQNDTRGALFDVSDLESMPTRTMEVHEPFLKKRVTFSGVDMADVLAAVGIEPGARTAHLTALDDYQVDLDLAMLGTDGILLATRDSGAPIQIDEGGPIRLIFPDGHATGANSDLWIWSIGSIDIR